MMPQLQSVEQLVREFAKMPTIGRRTAQKLAFYVLKLPAGEATNLANAIRAVKERVGSCSRCFNVSERELCVVCSDSRRDQTVICVVESVSDIMAFERSNRFRGLYHVLGGALSPIDGIEARDLKIEELMKRVDDDLTEVILATSPSTEGEATAMYIADLLKEKNVPGVVSRIALGVPMGSELEFSDELTLSKALEGRIRYT